MDPIVETVVRKYRERSDIGIQKYGKTLTRNDLDFADWLTHLQEELMDATLYIERLKRDVNTLKTTLPPEVFDRFRVQQIHNRVQSKDGNAKEE
jgi:hypothetical protein